MHGDTLDLLLRHAAPAREPGESVAHTCRVNLELVLERRRKLGEPDEGEGEEEGEGDEDEVETVAVALWRVDEWQRAQDAWRGACSAQVRPGG